MKFAAILAATALYASPALAGLCSAAANFDTKLLNTKYTITAATGLAPTDAAVTGELTITDKCSFRLSPVTIQNLAAGKTVQMIARQGRDPGFKHTIPSPLAETAANLDVTLPDTRKDIDGTNYGLSYNDFDM